MIQILPTDAVRLRALLSGAWPVPAIYCVPSRRARSLVITLDVRPETVHHHDEPEGGPDDGKK